MKRIKYGRLYWFPLEADDIDRFFWVRVFRKLGILYIPLTLRRYDELYLRDDRSKYSRRLINACRKFGIITFVVQEGPIYHHHQIKWSLIPLYADVFLCPPKDEPVWIEYGMPKQRIKTYDLQMSAEHYSSVMFLPPFVTWAENTNLRTNLRNAHILRTVYGFMDKDVLFRPDPRNEHLITPFLPPHRIVRGSEEELLKRYAKAPFPHYADTPTPPPSARSGLEGIALLGSFVTWNDLGFTWRKDFHNARIFESIAELAGKNVLFKPHPANSKLILPFLPPERVVWDKAENLIRQFDTIYTFWDSSVRKDCEMLGKTPILIGASERGPAA